VLEGGDGIQVGRHPAVRQWRKFAINDAQKTCIQMQNNALHREA